MDKLLTMLYRGEPMIEEDKLKACKFIDKLTPMQRHALMLCYRYSPREASRILGIDAYDFLINLGVLGVE